MKTTLISIIIASAIIGGAVFLSRGGSRINTEEPAGNVNIINGRQIIEIKAKGGYSPGKSIAQAGYPTVLRFNTSGTFDCSSSVRIPSMNISKILPPSGATDIDIGIPQAGVFQGSCSMGMYSFEIDFKS